MQGPWHLPDNLPVLAVCGWSGSGKTALIEAVLPRLQEGGLDVAVVKHQAHGIDLDRPGKDSDRLFRAGADVVLRGADEQLMRLHNRRAPDLPQMLALESSRHDLVLVEGHKTTPLPKVWLEPEGGGGAPAECGGVLAVLGPGGGREGRFLKLLEGWLAERWRRTPLFGCVLPGTAAAEDVAEQLEGLCDSVIGIGCPTDEPCAWRWPVLPVLESGHPAALLAAMRWAPHAAWLAVDAADGRPDPSVLEALKAAQRPGVWAALSVANDGWPRLVPGLYDFRARCLLEAGYACAADLADCPKVALVVDI